MLFSEFRTLRLAALMQEEWGRVRIPDLLEVYNIAQPQTVLEIGCYQGVSTEFWALHCGAVIAVDPWPDLIVRRRFQARVGHYPHVHIVEGCSPAMVDMLPVDSIQLAYIDGDHDYEPVKADIRAVMPKVALTGWIGGHDYGSCPGVQQAVDELLGVPEYRFSDGSWLIRKSYCK